MDRRANLCFTKLRDPVERFLSGYAELSERAFDPVWMRVRGYHRSCWHRNGHNVSARILMMLDDVERVGWFDEHLRPQSEYIFAALSQDHTRASRCTNGLIMVAHSDNATESSALYTHLSEKATGNALRWDAHGFRASCHAVVHRSPGGRHQLLRGCPLRSTNPTPNALPHTCASPDAHAAIRCCNHRNQCVAVCVAELSVPGPKELRPRTCLSNTRDRSHASFNFSEALGECHAHGMQLCSSSQLALGVCCKAGCHTDDKHVWSLTPCDGYRFSRSPNPVPPIQKQAWNVEHRQPKQHAYGVHCSALLEHKKSIRRSSC